MIPRFLIFSILFSLIGSQGIAQSTAPSQVPLEGTPYLEESYVRGTVLMKDQSQNTELRYNIFGDQFEFKGNGRVESLAPAASVSKVVIGKNTFVAEQYLKKGQMTYGFFVLMDSGKMGLVKKLNVVTTPYVPAAPFQDAKPASYERKADTYYVKVGAQTLLEVRNIKKLIQSLPDHQKEMEEFVKKEKISANDPDELVKFSTYYNSLK